MNKTTRNRIEKLSELLSDYKGKLEAVRSEIEDFKDAEQEKYDNLSEGLRGGERGEQMQEAVNTMENAFSSLESVESSLEDAIGHLTEIVENN